MRRFIGIAMVAANLAALMGCTGQLSTGEGGASARGRASDGAFTDVAEVGLRSIGGKFLVAEGGGGGVVNANRDAQGPWETFVVEAEGALEDGRAIHLRTADGHYLCAENGGGGELDATRTAAGPWETFSLRKIGEGGHVVSGNSVALQTWDGHHVVAEQGGGGVAHADREAIGPWETFTLIGAPGGAAPPPDRAGAPGPLHTEGTTFRNADGSIWSWHGVSAFSLLQKFLDGQDVRPFLRWARNLGANTVRVFGMWSVTGFNPANYGDAYFDGLGAFVDVAASEGLRVELSAITDGIVSGKAAQTVYLKRVSAVLASRSNAFLEIANEPWKNGVDPLAFNDFPPGLLVSRGAAADTPYLPPLQYTTYHSPRTADWPRKAKDALDIAAGYPGYAGVHQPVVLDEPMGAAEQSVAGRRSDVADDFFAFAAVAGLYAAGSTFHSDTGLSADITPAGSRQEACAQAMALAWRLVPGEAQLGRYTRGGLGDFPLAWTADDSAHDDRRGYAHIDGANAWVAFVRPADGWSPAGQGGWRIVKAEGPHQTFVTLAR